MTKTLRINTEDTLKVTKNSEDILRTPGPLVDLLTSLGNNTTQEIVKVVDIIGQHPATKYDVFFSTSRLVKKDRSKIAKENVGCVPRIVEHVVVIPLYDIYSPHKKAFFIYQHDSSDPRKKVPLEIEEIIINEEGYFELSSSAIVIEDENGDLRKHV